MKLELTHTPGQNRVTGYGADYVAVNGTRHDRSLLITAERVESWNIGGFDSLEEAHIHELMALGPEIVLLGTGPALRFPRPEIPRLLAAAGIGFEVMDSAAACRTYNVLMAEGRRVLAAILVG